MNKENKKKLSGTRKFLITVAVLFLLILWSDYTLALSAIIGALKMFFRIVPILVFVFVLNLVINKYVDIDILKKHLGDDSGWKGYFYAIAAGILIGGPPYILFPMLGDFKKGGARGALLATFLFNRNVKIPFIPVLIFYFGLTYTILLTIFLILFSVLNGIVVERLSRSDT